MSERRITLGLLFRSLGRFLTHGFARTKPAGAPRTVVVVQFGKLGDMVCTTPVFHALKQKFPESRVIVVGDQSGAHVLAGSPDVDRYIVSGPRIEAALAELQKERPDVGITVGPSFRAFALLYLAGARLIAAPRVEGKKSSESVSYRLIRTLGVLMPHRIGSYAPREYLRLLEPLGIHTEDTAKHLRYTKDAELRVDALLRQEKVDMHKPLVGIAASAGNKLKNWPPERFAAVADHLAQRYGATIVFVGGSGDLEESRAVERMLSPTTPYLTTTGNLSIEELKALVARLALFVSVDTGPIYIAEAFGVPTIDIVGPMDENEQPPRGPKHLVVAPPFRREPELFIMSPGRYDRAEARRQTESITAPMVIEAIDLLVPHLSWPL